MKPLEHQLYGENWIAENGRVILADDRGLGKTGTASLGLKRLEPWLTQVVSTGVPTFCTQNRVLILCPKKAIATWREQLPEWGILHTPTVIHNVSPTQRVPLWKSRFIITTPETYRIDVAKGTVPSKFSTVIVDEYHRSGLRNRRSLAFKGKKGGKGWAKQMETDNFILISGSSVKEGPHDLWGPLHLLNPQRFTSYWRWVSEYCIVEKGYFGTQITGAKKQDKMMESLQDLYLKRSFEEEMPGIPKKWRQPIRLDMDKEQTTIYDKLAEEMMYEIDGGALIMAGTVLTKIIRLRQLLVCPKLLDPSLGYGAGIEFIADELEDLPEEQQHQVIFTPFSKAVPYFKTYLQRRGFQNVMTLTGGASVNYVSDVEKRFRSDPRTMLIVSIKMAESYSLETGRGGYFLGYEYDVLDNEQAEDRLRRITTKNSVRIGYLIHRGTIEEDSVMPILDRKLRAIRTIYNSAHELYGRLKNRPQKTC